MKLSDFDYHVSEDQIAQHPLQNRDESRLFVLHRKTGKFEHRHFKDIIDYLIPGDLLILNDTKVIPVRIPGMKPSGGKAEITLLRELAFNSWEGLVKGVHEGNILIAHGISATVSRLNGTMAKIDFDIKADIKTFLNDIGVMPLPVYIKRKALKSDALQYQTVYAEKEGAVAAPTAGLHFTDMLIASIKDKGIHVRTITLHVGYGTFKPVNVDDIRDHQMDEEYFEISKATADAINSAKAEGRRIIAVGTTVTRALEASAQGLDSPLSRGGRGVLREQGEDTEKPRHITSGPDKTSIFIYPGYKFKIADTLITNFHLPGSTPMMLASAFADLTLLKKAYETAQKEGYRFFSFGDAMLIT